MSSQLGDATLSALNGALTVEEAPNNTSALWVLLDTNTDQSIAIWPSEVPEMCALLRAFNNREEARRDPDAHDCEEWAIDCEVDTADQTIYRCEVCNHVFTT